MVSVTNLDILINQCQQFIIINTQQTLIIPHTDQAIVDWKQSDNLGTLNYGEIIRTRQRAEPGLK
jgi:hypothetical protein